MRILIVGLGSMGRRRLRNLELLGGHELAGVELQAERASAVAAEHGIPIYGSFEEGLAWGPEAVVISTPPDRHTELALEAARHGLPFFTEASVVSTGMDELIETVQSAGVVAAPSCTMRFHPAVQTLRRLLYEHAVGRPLAVIHHVGQYLPDWHPWEDYRTFYVARRETGAAREIVPFELSWLTYLFGMPEALTGMRGRIGNLDADIDDVYSAILAFPGPLRCSLIVEVLSRPAVRLARIVTERGTLVWDWEARLVRCYRAEEDKWVDYPDPPPVPGPGGKWVAENMYIEEMRAFVAAVEGRADFPLTLSEDRALLGLLERIEESSDQLLPAA